jgi:3-deoxy-D-manno-octulosonic-acid transferase
LADDLVARGAVRVVRDPAALATEARRLLSDDQSRGQLAQAAGRWHRDNAGAIERTLAVIRSELAKLSQV